MSKDCVAISDNSFAVACALFSCIQEGFPALFTAAQNGHVELCTELLNHGALVNIQMEV